jgi:hypothetical protein
MMTDAEFYAKLSDLAEEAEQAGVTRTKVIESLRLLADALDCDEVWK